MIKGISVNATCLFSCLSLIIILIGCRPNQRNVYDEADYALIKVDTFNGRVGTQYYLYKFDTSRKLQIDYWGDGKLMAKAFTYRGKVDGWWTMYDYTGKLMALDSFSVGKKILSKVQTPVDTSMKIFRNDKLEPITSIDSLR